MLFVHLWKIHDDWGWLVRCWWTMVRSVLLVHSVQCKMVIVYGAVGVGMGHIPEQWYWCMLHLLTQCNGVGVWCIFLNNGVGVWWFRCLRQLTSARRSLPQLPHHPPSLYIIIFCCSYHIIIQCNIIFSYHTIPFLLHHQPTLMLMHFWHVMSQALTNSDFPGRMDDAADGD